MSKLKFRNLSSLIPSMEQSGLEKEYFSFAYAKRCVDCVFSFSNDGYELLVGILDLNFGFVIPISANRNGDYIAEISTDDYHGFCKAMGLSFQNDGFTSNELLLLLSSHIPLVSRGIRLPYEFMRDYICCRNIEESEKMYFLGWNDHSKDGKIARNFDKTEFFFGKTIADHCRKHNISSLWSADPRSGTAYSDPMSLS